MPSTVCASVMANLPRAPLPDELAGLLGQVEQQAGRIPNATVASAPTPTTASVVQPGRRPGGDSVGWEKNISTITRM